MKILVTGGAGFIGSFLCRQLLWRGYDVVAIDNFTNYYPKRCKELNIDLTNVAARKNIEFFSEDEVTSITRTLFSYYPDSKNETRGQFIFKEIDICDEEALERLFEEHAFDAIVHLAAMAGVPGSTKDPSLYTKVNVQGTLSLLKLAAAHAVSSFVFGSSSSVYGNRDDRKVREDDVVMPASVYGATKVAGEQLCHAFHKTFGLSVTVARIFGPIFGPLQRPYGMLAQRTINYVHNGKTLQIYGKNGLHTAKDSTYIDDTVQGLLLSLDNCDGFTIFNIGTSNPVSIQDLLDAIKTSFGKSVEYKVVDADKADVTSSADITKAMRVLHYKPSVSFEEGIKRQVETFNVLPLWYKEMDV